MATAIREVGVWRQTRTLLLKNYLIKCRTKKSSVQEILFPLFFLLWLILISVMHPNKKYEEVPDIELNPMLKTNVSLWKELESTKAVIMGETAVVEIDTFPRGVILIYLVIAFSPFGYFLAIHIVAEKEKKLKEFLKIMGLHDTAFWFSWVLLYTSLIFLMSLLMAVIATVSLLFPRSSSIVIFLLFFLYGLSSIFFALMLTPLFKKSKHVGIVEFFVTVAFGFVGLLIVLMESFPKSLVWIFSPFCQCTFLIGIAQVMHLEDFNEGALFSNLTEGPYPLIITLIMLVLNSIFYVLLAVYLDQVIPGEFGLRRSSLYFLKPSYWSKSKRNYKELSEGNVNGNISFSEVVEPVSSEFVGKEAIRISGIQKTYRKKGENVEALRIFLRIPCPSPSLFTQLLLLDEPTAGMDPCSRHIVWNLLKYRKANRVTVFSTHFMDEADILADRKAVISQGMLKCVGSSIFLKSKWGIGYRLSMYIDKYCATESLSSLVKQHIPGATLLQQNDQQLVYSLPFKDMDKFSDYSVFTQQPPDEEMDSKSFDEMEQSLLILSETQASLLSTMSLWKQQMYTIAKFHLLTLKRESKSVRSEITDIVFKIELYFQTALLGVIVTAMPPYFAMENAENHKIKAYTQLKLSGLLPSAYWIGQAIVDIPLFFVVLILMLGSLFAFHYGLYFYAVKFLAVLCFALSMLGNPQITLLDEPSTGMDPKAKQHMWKLSTKSRKRKFLEPPNNEDEDEDVKAERLKVKELISCQCCEEKPSIMVSNLHKEYDDKKDFLLSRKVKKVATKYISFCVKKGEILGLLGPNGAGKSTIINILVGDIEPTSGQVFLGDYSSEATEDDDSIKCMGYCPQINPLWPDITLQEHFEIYGAVKGMSTSDLKEVVSRRAIRTAFKNKKRAAILTTHYMEEAEAVCDRVAIMVSGQLRCIGTVQHLKSKFGKGYFLEIKLKDWIENLEIDRLQREIQYIFPNASRQESMFTVFVELTKEQEEEDNTCGTLNSTLWWERTQEDRVVF
ncbi:PREDICTED: ATP-binding cassette sub-family A member 5 [Propithecus coquereli]|uniref:ATP-binding cassette sub-family A member 5 n=1 Tax=Propithecus coquereli TaxID=379532 RepID=UPI00063F7AD1|nr:PREDICTED: ATP-binding cassette sub-family A member 5 [Propithecus coquereli]